MIYLIGTGLCSHLDLTHRATQAIQTCEHVYLENYTSLLEDSKEQLEQFLNKTISEAPRTTIEQDFDKIIQQAQTTNVAILIIGDVFAATTHTDMYLRAKQANIEVQVIHNASVLTAIGITGLSLYKFGKTPSMVFFQDNYKPITPYEVLKQNQELGLHTLMLVDIQADKQRYMTVNECIQQLFELETQQQQNVINKETFAIGCARLGHKDATIVAGTLEQLQQHNFGKPLHCLVLPGNMHFVEEEAVEQWKSF